MATAEKPAAIPQEDLDALQAAIDRAAKGVRDPNATRRACDEMDRATCLRELVIQAYNVRALGNVRSENLKLTMIHRVWRGQ